MDQVQPSISTFSEVESTKFNSVSYRAEPELSIKDIPVVTSLDSRALKPTK